MTVVTTFKRESFLKVAADGTQMWLTKDGTFHREDGPALVYRDGTEEWYENGYKHRKGGPAYSDGYGRQEYWLNGERHRADGPAVIFPGCFVMYFFGNRHMKNRKDYMARTDLTETEMDAIEAKYGVIE